LQKYIEQISFFTNMVSWIGTKQSCTRTRFSRCFRTGA
jgi:hypothetical protein